MPIQILPKEINDWVRGLAVGAAVVGVAWLAWPAPRQETRIVEKRVVETKVEWRDRVVVHKEDKVRVVKRTKTEVKPDGTQTQTQTLVTEERRRDSVERDSRTIVGTRDEGTREATHTSMAPLRNYHLSIGYAPVLRGGPDGRSWETGGLTRQQILVGGGVRLGSLPAFATATATWPFSNSLLPVMYLGIQVEL